MDFTFGKIIKKVMIKALTKKATTYVFFNIFCLKRCIKFDSDIIYI